MNTSPGPGMSASCTPAKSQTVGVSDRRYGIVAYSGALVGGASEGGRAGGRGAWACDCSEGNVPAFIQTMRGERHAEGKQTSFFAC